VGVIAIFTHGVAYNFASMQRTADVSTCPEAKRAKTNHGTCIWTVGSYRK